MLTSDHAMVSRIRIEVRGSSMEAAEEAAVAVLEHARMAGFLEGLVPQTGNWSDHHFHRPEMTGAPSDPPEPWTELGLPYAGRLTFTFEPEVAHGGLRQFGFAVAEVGGSDVSEKVIVLHRRNEVMRDRVGELGQATMLTAVDAGPAKPTGIELAAFTSLAVRPEITEIAYGLARSRSGYEIELSYFFPTSDDMGIGGRMVIFGPTFGDAITSAVRFVEESLASSAA